MQHTLVTLRNIPQLYWLLIPLFRYRRHELTAHKVDSCLKINLGCSKFECLEWSLSHIRMTKFVNRKHKVELEELAHDKRLQFLLEHWCIVLGDFWILTSSSLSSLAPYLKPQQLPTMKAGKYIWGNAFWFSIYLYILKNTTIY